MSAFIELKGETFREGIFLEAQLAAREEQNAIEIPRNLLQQNNQVFYVSNDTILNTLAVEPVYFSDKNVVLKGIPDGTKLLSKPLPGAYAGMLVKIFEESEKALESNANALQQ